MSNKVLFGIIAGVVLAFGVFYATSKPTRSLSQNESTASLASLNAGGAPWQPEYQHLTDRLRSIHMSLLGTEGAAQHIHAHLDIYVHGAKVTVPAEIGIPPTGGITILHTHDTTGIIHIESPDATDKYTLGEFFDIWGVKLTSTSVGEYANDSSNKLVVYDNGVVSQDPVQLVLSRHHEIVLTYGSPKEQPVISDHYSFPSGL